MKELLEKHYTFTLMFITLIIILIVFKDNKDIVNVIVGCFVGLITAPNIDNRPQP